MAPPLKKKASVVSWSKIAPKTKTQRKTVASKCGKKKCFLLPEKLKFPICNKECQVSCQGLRAAKTRAAQWGYQSVYNAVTKKSQTKKCVYSE